MQTHFDELHAGNLAVVRTAFIVTQTSVKQLAEVASVVDQSEVTLNIAKTLPLEKAREANELLEVQSVQGKLVFTT
jgi:NADPH:quinone reductase-like Zn-dependent oxidoreductase